jgi:hypothetical protein
MREVDLLSQRNEVAGGKFVVLVQFLDHLEIVGSWKIERP